MGAAFTLNILFARYFAAAESGRVFYLFAVFAFVTQVLSLSLESGVAYHAARNSPGSGMLTGFSLVWGFVSGLTGLLIIAVVTYLLNLKLNFPIAYPACYIIGNMLIGSGNALCYAKYRFIMPGAVALLINLLLIVLLISFHSSMRRPACFVDCYFYSFLIHGLLLYSLMLVSFKVFPLFAAWNFAVIRDVVRYSLYAFAGNLIFLLLSRVDYFFVKTFCTPAELGNYIQVSKIAQVFFILPSMIASVLFPVIAGGLKPATGARIRTMSVVILMTYCLILAVLAAFGWWLFPLLYGPSFSGMFVPFVLLVPGIISISCLYPYTAYYAAVNRQLVNIKGSLIALIFIVVFDALLIPAYGIRAAALVSSAGYIVFQLCVTAVFRKDFRLSFKQLFTLNRQEYLYIKSAIKS